MQIDTFRKIIFEICDELGIEVKLLSRNWVMQLKKGDSIKYIVGATLPINSQSTNLLCSDKYATYEVLKSENIPVIEHRIMFDPVNRSAYATKNENENLLKQLLNKYKKLVIKPNNGYDGLGIGVYTDFEEAQKHIEELFKKNTSISICPFYDIEMEYRAFFYRGKILKIYGKTRPFVIGDGTATLGELIQKLNLPNKIVVKENLAKLDLDRVLAKDEKMYISWKHNLAGGATAKDLEKGELYDKIEKIALKSAKAVDAEFVTVDIIKTTNNELLVMEVNSSIGASIYASTVEGGYEFVKNMYKDAFKTMFC